MNNLPVNDILPQLIAALCENDSAVLEAPPGAGKTTVVPLALLKQPWLGKQKILLIQPRRIAAKSSASRLSFNLSTQVGQRIGYRIKGESKVSTNTQLEVITEGILTRMLQEDPSLEEVGLIIFDEFHERSLNNDLNLALCLEGRTLFRQEQPLKILLMSATLNGDESAKILGDAPIITSQGRSYPIDIIYSSTSTNDSQKEDFILRIANRVRDALQQQKGNILVFLPGKGEIEQVRKRLQELLSSYDKQVVDILPLYAGLSFEQQQKVTSLNNNQSDQMRHASQITKKLPPYFVLRKKRKKSETYLPSSVNTIIIEGDT